MSTYQSSDGGQTWQPAEPLPYYPGIDWEVAGPAKGTGPARYEAIAYEAAEVYAIVQSRWKWTLHIKMMWAQRAWKVRAL